VHYWAAAKEAAKTAEETVRADTLADALDAVRGERAGDSRFAAVLARSSFLVDGAPAGRRAADAVVLAEESVIEVLPAFAGG
jgi:molybdopterin converting factor small subunit